MPASWEAMRVPDEYDREFLIRIFNNHATAIGKLVKQNDYLIEKVNKTAQVVWHVVRKVCPDEARLVMDEIAEELDMRDRIDELFADLDEEVDEEREDGE